MKAQTAVLALLLPTLCACATNRPSGVNVRTPPQAQPPGIEHPGQVVINQTQSCGDLAGYVARWQSVLRMDDWRVAIECLTIPEERNAWALSQIVVALREIAIVVDPATPDIEMAVLHELLHGIATEIRAGNSDLLEEQFVRTLTEAAICRKPKGEP